MATGLTEWVQEIAETRGISESEVLEQALERGVEDLWIDFILSWYVNDESLAEFPPTAYSLPEIPIEYVPKD